MNELTPIRQLVQHVCRCESGRIPKAERQKARRRMLDVLGCALGGAQAPGNRELLELLRQKEGPQKATVWAHGGALAMEDAALINSVSCRSYDFEVMTPAHLYACIVPTALAVGQAYGRSLAQVLDALVLATDVCARVAEASGLDAPKGFDPAGTSALLGAVTAAGRLMELDERQQLFAYGHSLNMMCGSFENMWAGSTSFKFNQGWAAWCGIFSAKLALIGWTAPTDPLQGRAGYYALYTSGGRSRPEHLTRGLGKQFYDMVIHKPYPSCRFNHSAIQCALALRERYEIKPEQVQAVHMYLPAWQTGLFICAPFAPSQEFAQGSALFNMRFNTACALTYGQVLPHLFTPQVILDPELARLARRVDIAPLPKEDPHQGRMEILLADGRSLCHELEFVKGDVPGDEMTDEEFIEKYWYNVGFNGRVQKEQADQILALCRQGESARDLARLMEQMVCKEA